MTFEKMHKHQTCERKVERSRTQCTEQVLVTGIGRKGGRGKGEKGGGKGERRREGNGEVEDWP